MASTYINDLIKFIKNSPTAFNASVHIAKSLDAADFICLDEADAWQLEAGKAYYVVRNNSAVFAFRLGHGNISEYGYHLIGAHTDSPGFKIKPFSETKSKEVISIGAEVYGGPILHTWTDRELSLAGRVVVDTPAGPSIQLIDLAAPVAIIPNAAIHMNREVNNGFKYNPQTHLRAILSVSDDADEHLLSTIIAKHMGIDVSAVLDYDLYLYDLQKPSIVGHNKDMLVAGRLDDLQMCHAVLQALTESVAAEFTSIGIFFDNEEIGSQTLQGANSSFVMNLLTRIMSYQSTSSEDLQRALAKSFLISADGAHAHHPAFASAHDSQFAPQINKGPVIKISASYRYATTAESAVYFQGLCKKAKVPCQKIINRSDLRSGSTIGPMSSAALSIKGVDVGLAQWAMHSVRESVGTLDHAMIIKVFKEFYK